MTPNKGQLLLNGIMVSSPDHNHIAGVTKLLMHVKENGWKCATPILISERFLNTLPGHVIELFQLMSTELYKGLTFAPTLLPEPQDTQERLHFHSPKDQAILCVQGASKKPDANWTNVLETIHSTDFALTSGLTYDQLMDGHKLKDKELTVFQVPHGENMTTDEWASFYSTFAVGFYLVSGGGERGLKKEILQGIIKANVQRSVPKPCTILLTNSRGLDAEKISDLESEEIEWYSKIKICHINDLFHPRVAPQPNIQPPPTFTTIPQIPPPPYPSTDTPPESNSSDENAPEDHFNTATDHGAQQTEEGSANPPICKDNVTITLPPPQFITIDLKSGVVNPESILEWSPQSYIHMLRCCINRGLIPVSGKPRLPFYYHGAVTIKKENTGHYIRIKEDGLPKGYSVEKHLHVICTPVPHKPWNEAEFNLCYVVQETIEHSTIESFPKVLFLLADGEGGLADCQCYKMFGYDNNQWKIRHYKSLFVVKSVEQT